MTQPKKNFKSTDTPARIYLLPLQSHRRGRDLLAGPLGPALSTVRVESRIRVQVTACPDLCLVPDSLSNGSPPAYHLSARSTVEGSLDQGRDPHLSPSNLTLGFSSKTMGWEAKEMLSWNHSCSFKVFWSESTPSHLLCASWIEVLNATL